MTFCLGVAEAKLAIKMVNQLARGSKPSVVCEAQQIMVVSGCHGTLSTGETVEQRFDTWRDPA